MEKVSHKLGFDGMEGFEEEKTEHSTHKKQTVPR